MALNTGPFNYQLYTMGQGEITVDSIVRTYVINLPLFIYNHGDLHKWQERIRLRHFVLYLANGI